MTQTVVVVTGSAGALGSVVARTLSASGVRVALFDTAAARSSLETLAGELPGSHAFTVDAASADEWDRSMVELERVYGCPPSGAALIAGGWSGGRALHDEDRESHDAVWSSMMRANLDTVRVALRGLLPSMVSRGEGSVVAIGSKAAVQPWTSARASAYAASKAAVVALCQATAAEVRPSGVRVNVVLPGTIDTPANRAAMPDADVTRWVSPVSIAHAIRFLLSDEAKAISGAALPMFGDT